MVLLSAFFSGSEIAFVAANRLRVEVLARRWSSVGPVVQRFIQNPSTFLTTTLVGNNLALVIYSTLIAFYLNPPLEAFFGDRLGLQATSTEAAVLAAQTFIAATITLLFGEVLPKSLLRETADLGVFVLAIPLRLAYYVLLPMIKVAGWTSSLLVKLFQADAETFSQFMRRDFELMIREGMESGELDLDQEESELLTNVLALGSIRVKESMAPRTDIIAVEENTPIEAFLERCVTSGHSKLPVYRENIDHIIGIAFAYGLFQEPKSLEEITRPVQFVPESKLSKDLLYEFLDTNTSIAVVIDEYGGTAGLVTTEDLLEELFGDIQDEFDTDDAELRQIGENTFVASGRAEIDELIERFDVQLSTGDYETVAGYLLDRLGTIPLAKDEFVIDGYRFIIMQATAHRIDLVKIIKVG
jgi:CBS domain containing-hemolysin-like protein